MASIGGYASFTRGTVSPLGIPGRCPRLSTLVHVDLKNRLEVDLNIDLKCRHEEVGAEVHDADLYQILCH